MPDNTRLPEIDITVIQRPVDVEFACPICKQHHKIDYWKFVETYGRPADWSKIKCPNCNAELLINDTDWD